MVNPKPIVLLFTWLGSSPQLACKYSQIYQNLGLKVILKCPSLTHFLWPRSGIKDALQFLIKIKEEIGPHGCPIVVHGISVGCYYYSLILHHFKSNPTEFSVIEKNIRCQFIDSPVVRNTTDYATTIAAVVASSKLAEFCIWAIIALYLYLTRPYTGQYYEYCMHLIRFEQPIVPSLMMSSIGDPMTPKKKFDALCQCYLQRGCDVTIKFWEDSVHAQHLKHHTATYKELVYNLLSKAVPELAKPNSLL